MRLDRLERLDHLWPLMFGLTAIFVANAVAAVVDPEPYRHLLEDSPFSRWVGLDGRAWSTALIAVNDGLIALALVVAATLRRGTGIVLAAAGAWLAVAAVLKLSTCLA
jgi:hypothetical protein